MWVFLGWNLKKNIGIFEISVIRFALLESLMQKQKPLNLKPKIPDLGICGLEPEKTIFIFEISTLEFV